jgi:hypothetical protein
MGLDYGGGSLSSEEVVGFVVGGWTHEGDVTLGNRWGADCQLLEKVCLDQA